MPLVVAPASPFIVSKGRAQVTFVVKKMRWEKTKEKKVASGVVVFLLIWWEQFPLERRDVMALIFWPLIRWCDMLWPCFVLCASVPSRMGSTGAQIHVERGVGGTVVITPIIVEV
jgi:hypothetical protein